MSVTRPALSLFGALAIVLVLFTGAGASERMDTIGILALGASNTEGYGVAVAESYPARLQALLEARGLSVRIVNAGISGDTTSGMLTRLGPHLTSDIRLVILQPGINDARYFGPEQRASNLAEIKRRVSERGIPLLIIENRWLVDAAGSDMQDDGIHFTAAGYARIAERLLPEVLKALGK